MTLQRSETEQVSRKQASSSVLKALDTIDVLAETGRPLTLRELSKRLDRPMPTVHRLLRTLELRQYVENIDGSYRLTLKLFEIGTAVVSGIDVVAEARPICEELCREMELTINMAVRSGTSAVYVMKLEGSRSMRLISQLGLHVPLHCTAMGKVLVAFDTECDALLDEITLDSRTKTTLTTRNALEKELLSVKKNGFAVDNQEFDVGLVCIAAPVFDREGRIASAISVTGAAERFTRKEWPSIGLRIKQAADDVSTRLGFGLSMSGFVGRAKR